MVVQRTAGHGRDHPRAALPAAARTALRQRELALLEAYTAAGQRMRGLPVYNEKLDIRMVGLQRWRDGMLCIAVTPWCMNILLLPGESAPRRLEGTARDVEFPSGSYSFVAGELAGVGPMESCSLFSPMEQFDDPEVAVEVARHAIRELLREPGAPAMSRRRFMRGGRHAG
jgi:[NiFe] hydrogenase assembly HybE family chaperone